MQKIRLALLAGGKSGEREVSLQGAAEVEKALNPEKYEVKRYDPATDLPALIRDAERIDVAFILLHGRWGEDGTVQGFLELLEIPYQGADVLGSAMAMDKHVAKLMYRNAGLQVADWVMATMADCANPERIIEELGLPVVVKPIRQGSSLGMSIPRNREDLISGLRQAFNYDREVMVEKFIKGREITVGIIGNDELTALPLVEIIPGANYQFFNYEAKYQPGASREVCPAELDQTIAAQAQEWGIRAHRALKLRGYSRTDMIVSGDDLYVLETNTIPGMTPTSLLPQAAAAFGLSFGALLDRLIELAMA
ncbi:MAG: D-alanine--D-alanine ligase [Proteobacteria bacterium]|nr:D-alanine--D-alanine ligase [Pseudomonadota bacterium]MBU1714013.1 D-alanine--D-alanine ligase [Pseudomonadota bacterium]